MRNSALQGWAFIAMVALMHSIGAAQAADYADYQQAAEIPPDLRQTVSVLPKDVSRSLTIHKIPTSEPVPLIVGTYWSCHINQYDFEICRIKIVVCNDDQTSCVEVD